MMVALFSLEVSYRVRYWSVLCCLLVAKRASAFSILPAFSRITVPSAGRRRIEWFAGTSSSPQSSSNCKSTQVINDYSPQAQGCVKNKQDHIRLLDQSLERTSGRGIFGRVNDMLWEEQEDGSNNCDMLNITSWQQLDDNPRFGILSHGTQDDPIYNYGNRASMELFEQNLENLCQTPSRYSTVASLMEDRDYLIQQIADQGYGTLHDAIRITASGSLFVMNTIWVWNVLDDQGQRIGLAALYDRDKVTDYEGPPL